MTISLERPVTPQAQTTPHYSVVDPYEQPHAVVEVRIEVTRDPLAAALEMGATGYYGRLSQPDDWPVEEIRAFVQMNLVTMSSLELQQGAESMAFMAGPATDDLSTQWYIQGVYRAVDRAFPLAGHRSEVTA